MAKERERKICEAVVIDKGIPQVYYYRYMGVNMDILLIGIVIFLTFLSFAFIALCSKL